MAIDLWVIALYSTVSLVLDIVRYSQKDGVPVTCIEVAAMMASQLIYVADTNRRSSAIMYLSKLLGSPNRVSRVSRVSWPHPSRFFSTLRRFISCPSHDLSSLVLPFVELTIDHPSWRVCQSPSSRSSLSSFTEFRARLLHQYLNWPPYWVDFRKCNLTINFHSCRRKILASARVCVSFCTHTKMSHW